AARVVTQRARGEPGTACTTIDSERVAGRGAEKTAMAGGMEKETDRRFESQTICGRIRGYNRHRVHRNFERRLSIARPALALRDCACPLEQAGAENLVTSFRILHSARRERRRGKTVAL